MLPVETGHELRHQAGDRVQRTAGPWPRLVEGTDQRLVGSIIVVRPDPRPAVRTWGSSGSVFGWKGERRSGAVGGDEETRTPDPLLAKEMLCQLSYVPSPVEWWAFLDSNQRPLPYQGSALTS